MHFLPVAHNKQSGLAISILTSMVPSMKVLQQLLSLLHWLRHNQFARQTFVWYSMLMECASRTRAVFKGTADATDYAVHTSKAGADKQRAGQGDKAIMEPHSNVP